MKIVAKSFGVTFSETANFFSSRDRASGGILSCRYCGLTGLSETRKFSGIRCRHQCGRTVCGLRCGSIPCVVPMGVRKALLHSRLGHLPLKAEDVGIDPTAFVLTGVECEVDTSPVLQPPGNTSLLAEQRTPSTCRSLVVVSRPNGKLPDEQH